MKIQLTQITNEQSERKGELNDLQSWVKSFVPKQWNSNDVKLINHNFINTNFTHSGLIYYMHACWAKELGCVLRPDMIYFTILSEIGSHVLSHPKDFKALFTNHTEKQNVIVEDVLALHGGMNIFVLCHKLKQVVANKELHQLICDLKFSNDNTDSCEARCMTFCNMGIPYFNYLTTFCGIRSIDIQGQLNDWETLLNALNRLKAIFTPYDSYGTIITLLNNSVRTIMTLIHFTFNPKCPADSRYQSQLSFFNDIFHYGNNTKCGSGHDRYIVSGWIRNFYLTNNDDIVNFNTSMSYVPYLNIETKRKFVQVCTLSHSEIVNGTAIPHYGKITFEILNNALFNEIAMKKNDDSMSFLF